MNTSKIYLFFILIILGSCNVAFAAKYYTKGTGDWTGSSIWGTTTTTEAGSLWSSITLVAGDEIYIDDNITLSSNLTISVKVKIFLNATLTFDNGKLFLTDDSSIDFQSSSARVVSTQNGNADRINFGGGTSEWDGGNADLTGPGTLDTNSNGTLPIELIFFHGSTGLIGVSLNWATASELNFNYFDIEKSSDGANFYSIANIKGKGTTIERHDYSLTDEKPLIGKNYYRLKSVDFDGYTEYFNVIMVDFDGKKQFSVYPNPSEGVSFTTETNFTPESRAFVVVYTTIGSEVARYEVSGAVSTLTLPVKLESGVYYAKYISSDFTSAYRVLVK